MIVIRAPTLWYSLPTKFRHTKFLASLKSLRTTFLFVKAIGNVIYVIYTVYFGGRALHRPRKNPFNYGADPNHSAETQIIFHFSHNEFRLKRATVLERDRQ